MNIVDLTRKMQAIQDLIDPPFMSTIRQQAQVFIENEERLQKTLMKSIGNPSFLVLTKDLERITGPLDKQYADMAQALGTTKLSMHSNFDRLSKLVGDQSSPLSKAVLAMETDNNRLARASETLFAQINVLDEYKRLFERLPLPTLLKLEDKLLSAGVEIGPSNILNDQVLSTVDEWLLDLNSEVVEQKPLTEEVLVEYFIRLASKYGPLAQKAVAYIFIHIIIPGIVWQAIYYSANIYMGDDLPVFLQAQKNIKIQIKETNTLLIEAYPAKELDSYRIIDVKTFLRVRQLPSRNGEIIGMLPPAIIVRLIEKSDNYDWSMVLYKDPITSLDSIGWVCSRYLKRIQAPPRYRMMSKRNCE